MTELTAEKRAELRRLAANVLEASRCAMLPAGSYPSDTAIAEAVRARGSALAEFSYATSPNVVLSLLDALDAAEAKLQPAKAFAYTVGFSDGYAHTTNYAWIGPVPNNPYVDKKGA